MRVIDLIENGSLPKGTPHLCMCGAELETNDALTDLHCTSEICPIHVSYQLLKTLDVFNMKCGIGENRALELVSKLGIYHQYLIFDEEYTEKLLPLSDACFINLYGEVYRIKENKITVSEFMTGLQLETIGSTRAKMIFTQESHPLDIFKDLNIDYDAYTSGNPPKDDYEEIMKFKRKIAKRIKVDLFSPTVHWIVMELIFNYKWIEITSKFFKFKESYDKTVVIAITGSITKLRKDDGTSFGNREELCPYLSEKTGMNIICPNSVTSKHTRYLVMDTHMESNRKYKTAVRNGIEVVTSEELYNILMEEAKKDGE